MKKEEQAKVQKEEMDKNEINLEDLEQVTGGSLRNVVYTPTYDISEDTRRNI